MSDPTRKIHRELTAQEQANVADIKAMGECLLKALDAVTQGKPSREIALAKTKVEEAVMWAVKGMTG
ncbi:MAG: hypothetical protein ACK41C_10440 [Phenylobacterium sp.]|uniref:Acb2/Tad1 domain-containing protein n=1 Tax=Phenylobacterium sp. TaxID=1871053 RepID=UPI00391DD762